MRTRTKVFIGIFLVLLIALCVVCAVFLGQESENMLANYRNVKQFENIMGERVTNYFMRLFSFYAVIVLLGIIVILSVVVLIGLIFKQNFFFKVQFAYEKYKKERFLRQQKNIDNKKQKLKDKISELEKNKKESAS